MSYRDDLQGVKQMMMTPTVIIWRWPGIGNRCLPVHSGPVASCAGRKNDDGVVLLGGCSFRERRGWKCVQAYAVILKQVHLLFLVFIHSLTLVITKCLLEAAYGT